jgi:DNA-binding IclR family transcriptional regulator
MPGCMVKLDVRRSAAGIYHVQVLDRAVAILQVLAETPTDLSAAEIAERLVLHKSTIHRLLMVLEHHGFIRKHAGTGKCTLGLKLFELGSRAAKGLTLREHAQPFLARLVRETGETAHIGVLDEGDMVSVANVEGPFTLRMPSTVGRRTPAHCSALGKAVLAFLPGSTLDELLARRPLRALTSKSLAARGALKADLQRIRVRGYAIDDEEIEKGLRCVGAPVRDYSGLVVGAVSIAGPTFRIPKSRVPALAELVMAIARELSVELGCRPDRPRIPVAIAK